MITSSELEKYDPNGMHKIYDQWPKIAKKAYHSDYKKISFEGITHIVFVGMGGSGAIGDLFSSILSTFIEGQKTSVYDSKITSEHIWTTFRPLSRASRTAEVPPKKIAISFFALFENRLLYSKRI